MRAQARVCYEPDSEMRLILRSALVPEALGATARKRANAVIAVVLESKGQEKRQQSLAQS